MSRVPWRGCRATSRVVRNPFPVTYSHPPLALLPLAHASPAPRLALALTAAAHAAHAGKAPSPWYHGVAFPDGIIG
eukprot:3171908-Prymnesium_polylepis.1